MRAHELSDVIAHRVFVFRLTDLALQKAHTDNGKDGLLSCSDIADHHLAKGLVEPILDSYKLSLKEIYRHKNTSFLGNLGVHRNN